MLSPESQILREIARLEEQLLQARRLLHSIRERKKEIDGSEGLQIRDQERQDSDVRKENGVHKQGAKGLSLVYGGSA